jgi:predicted ribosome quality control (RQC) complex YloA/Tae2 family protein
MVELALKMTLTERVCLVSNREREIVYAQNNMERVIRYLSRFAVTFLRHWRGNLVSTDILSSRPKQRCGSAQRGSATPAW